MIIVFRINLLIGLLMMLLCPIYFLVYKKFRDPIFSKNLVAKEKSAEFFQDYTYQLEYLEDIIIESEFERENRLLKKKYIEFLEKFKEFISINAKLSFSQGIIVTAMQVFIYLVGGISVLNGYTTVGRLSILLSYFVQILNKISYYNELARNYQINKTAIHRIDELIAIPIIKEGEQKIGTIECIKANVSFSIDERPILKNIKIDAHIGDVIGVIGNNGAGKTTLLKILIGVLKLNDNDNNSLIMYNDKYSIKDIDTIDLRKRALSYIPQKIRFRDTTMSEAFNEVGDYNIYSDFINTLKINNVPVNNDIDNFIKNNWNKKVNNLSGGDRQLVAILRNINKKSSILFFDEPTSNLDTTRIEWFMQLVSAIKDNKITFVITHDNKISNIFDKVIRLES